MINVLKHIKIGGIIPQLGPRKFTRVSHFWVMLGLVVGRRPALCGFRWWVRRDAALWRAEPLVCPQRARLRHPVVFPTGNA
jgi:hypothetical protein